MTRKSPACIFGADATDAGAAEAVMIDHVSIAVRDLAAAAGSTMPCWRRSAIRG